MNLGRRVSWWIAMFTAVAIVGCEANHYEVEIKPTGDTVQRELTVSRLRSAEGEDRVVTFSDDELVKIAAAYDTEIPAETAKKHKFAGVFSGEMPHDVGGSGSYTHWNTPLGSMAAYVERFRGNDDLVADVEKRQEALDRMADLLLGWFASELDGAAGFQELHEFLDRQFRRDLKNLGFYAWAFEIASDDEESAVWECLVRISRYLIERSYLTTDQIPMLARAMRESDGGAPAHLLALIQRFTASKMGVASDQPIPACLQFLGDATAVEASLNDYLRGSDEYKLRLRAWEREIATNPEAKKPEASTIISDLLEQAFLPNFQLGRSDRLDVKLAAGEKPFLTNGQWDEEAGHVLWSRHLLSADSHLSEYPTLVFALWSVPDRKEQELRFGRSVLEGRSLGEYCLWYRGLSAAESKEWDDFVATLKADDSVASRIRVFRFSRQPVRGDVPEGFDPAEQMRDLILPNLDE